MDFSAEQSIRNRITRIGIRDQRLAKTEISIDITTIYKNNKYNIFLLFRNLARRNASIGFPDEASPRYCRMPTAIRFSAFISAMAMLRSEISRSSKNALSGW